MGNIADLAIRKLEISMSEQVNGYKKNQEFYKYVRAEILRLFPPNASSVFEVRCSRGFYCLF